MTNGERKTRHEDREEGKEAGKWPACSVVCLSSALRLYRSLSSPSSVRFGRDDDEAKEEGKEPRKRRDQPSRRILQITVYYKELLTINCQGTNHPRSILSFMDISIPAVCLSRCRHTLSIPFRRVQRPRPRRPQGPAHAGRTGRGTEAEWGETWEASDRRPPGGRNGASSVSPSLSPSPLPFSFPCPA